MTHTDLSHIDFDDIMTFSFKNIIQNHSTEPLGHFDHVIFLNVCCCHILQGQAEVEASIIRPNKSVSCFVCSMRCSMLT